jgi:hypothetical protein
MTNYIRVKINAGKQDYAQLCPIKEEELSAFSDQKDRSEKAPKEGDLEADYEIIKDEVEEWILV